MNKRKNAEKGCKWLFVCAVLSVYTLLVLLFCIFLRSFSEAYCRTVSSFMRRVIASLTSPFPFSLAELLLFALPLLFLIFLVVKVIRRTFNFKRMLKKTLVFLSVLFFLFVNVFGVCYTRETLERNMGFEIVKFSDGELKESAEFVRTELEATLDDVTFDKDGASVNSLSWDKMNKELDIGFSRLSNEYSFISDFNSNAKRIALSPLMTYTHISGIFIPFTAEANVNTNYPDYVVAFSTAHEKAHQRGIAGEDEANFVAFLACLASENKYLRYSALLSMYDYYLDEAYKTDKELYVMLLNETDKRVLFEMYAYSIFFDKYRDSNASKVADKVNDTYIKTMGDSGGIKSYGRVVTLCTSYLIQKEALPY